MNEIKIKNDVPKRSGWLRKLVWLAGIVVVLLVVIYFVATSSAFLKGVILPKVSKSLGVDVTVNARISPFSDVLLSDLKIQPPGRRSAQTIQIIEMAKGNIQPCGAGA